MKYTGRHKKSIFKGQRSLEGRQQAFNRGTKVLFTEFGHADAKLKKVENSLLTKSLGTFKKTRNTKLKQFPLDTAQLPIKTMKYDSMIYVKSSLNLTEYHLPLRSEVMKDFWREPLQETFETCPKSRTNFQKVSILHGTYRNNLCICWYVLCEQVFPWCE